MNSEPTYVVIAIADGDGSCAIGHRIWSERFDTRIAAEQACSFLKHHEIRVRLIEDRVYERLAERVPPAAA